MPPHAALAAAATPEQLCACAAAVMRGGHHAMLVGSWWVWQGTQTEAAQGEPANNLSAVARVSWGLGRRDWVSELWAWKLESGSKTTLL